MAPKPTKQKIVPKIAHENAMRNDVFEKSGLVGDCGELYPHQLASAIEGYGGREIMVPKLEALKEKTRPPPIYRRIRIRESQGMALRRVQAAPRSNGRRYPGVERPNNVRMLVRGLLLEDEGR